MGATKLDEGQSWDLSQNEINELILKPVFVSENVFNSTFKVMPRVKDKAKMYFLGAPSRFIQKNNACDFTPKGSMPLTVRDIAVQRLKIEMKQCKDEVFDTCLEKDLTGEGNAIFEPGSTEADASLIAGMTEQIAAGISNDLFKLASFAKPGQTISIIGSTDFYDVDSALSQGLFPNIEEDVAAGRIVQVDAGSGTALGSGDAVDIFKGLWGNRSLEFKGLEAELQLHEIHCTQSIADNYLDTLEALGTEAANSIIVNGVRRLTWRGIPVIPKPVWDAELQNPQVFALTAPHRAVLTVANNMRVATDLTSQDVELRIYTDIHRKNIYTQGYLRFGGARICHPELVVYAK